MQSTRQVVHSLASQIPLPQAHGPQSAGQVMHVSAGSQTALPHIVPPLDEEAATEEAAVDAALEALETLEELVALVVLAIALDEVAPPADEVTLPSPPSPPAPLVS